ncbi:methionine gamma-lyase [Sporohalobacter salinus]|uniref:methionine gamma-lyase n=1 Tax=Sporohalobacter salinus TaxID=1494606 RepID=UPI00195F8A2E|nr:methionine gamma-lyase [Sporohalobacter salinus]MBM7624093.1 methionine-gamma-lyase [Sporohalobacter salinus]
MTKDYSFETRTVHADEGYKNEVGALRTPIYQSSTFVFDDAAQGAKRFAGEEDGCIYTRLGNPTQSDLEKQMANLDGGEAAIATASGMAAISGVILGILEAGDHLVASDTLYGCTHAFLSEMITKWGIEVTFVDMSDLDNVKEAVQENTKAIYTETPSNPTLSLVDIEGVSEISDEHDLMTIVDNTFMSPYLQHPLELGADIVVYSATKSISGHGDTVAGIIVGPEELLAEWRMTTIKDIGGIIAPFNAFLLLRGLKTLAVRMDRICENAMKVAEFLADHPKVEEVHYPGLESHPQHELAKKQMDDFGGLMAFELKGGYEAGEQLMDTVELCTLAVSLGDVDTLIQHPASMTHSPVPEKERLEAGITNGLVRLSIGIESADDLIADLDQALNKL